MNDTLQPQPEEFNSIAAISAGMARLKAEYSALKPLVTTHIFRYAHIETVDAAILTNHLMRFSSPGIGECSCGCGLTATNGCRLDEACEALLITFYELRRESHDG